MKRPSPISPATAALLGMAAALAWGRLAADEPWRIDLQRLTSAGGTSAAGAFFVSGRIWLQSQSLTLAGGGFSMQGGWSALPVVGVAALTPANQPPTPGALTVQAARGRVVKVYLPRLLEVAYEPDGDALRVSGVSPVSAHGAVVSRQGDWIIYTPQPGTTLPDSVSYELTDELQMVTGLFTVEEAADDGEPSGNRVALRVVGTDVVLDYAGIPNRPYRVQASSALEGPWVDLGTVTADGFGRIQFTEIEGGTYPVRYYRTKAP